MPKKADKTVKTDVTSEEKKVKKDTIEEVDLDSLGLELEEKEDKAEGNSPEKEELDTEQAENEDTDEDESVEEIAVLQKERSGKKMPIDRSQDKRRIGKGIQKFIDNEIPEDMLEGLPEEIQELMKK